jgi:GNAT superfamily N-acetyltransferase
MNKILNEMPAWNDDDKAIGSNDIENNDSIRSYNKMKEKGKTPVSSTVLGDYTIEIYEPGEVIVAYVLFQGSPVGLMRCQKTSNGLPIIIMMYVIDAHQGKGLGTALYKAMIKQYGGIISDKTLTGEDGIGGSFKVWEKLGSLYPNNSYVIWMNQWNDDFMKDRVTKVNSFTRDMMDKRSERFMICTRSSCEQLAGGHTKKILELWNK